MLFLSQVKIEPFILGHLQNIYLLPSKHEDNSTEGESQADKTSWSSGCHLQEVQAWRLVHSLSTWQEYWPSHLQRIHQRSLWTIEAERRRAQWGESLLDQKWLNNSIDISFNEQRDVSNISAYSVLYFINATRDIGDCWLIPTLTQQQSDVSVCNKSLNKQTLMPSLKPVQCAIQS